MAALLLALIAVEGDGDEIARRAAAEIDRVADEIARLAEGDGARESAAELEVARRWVEEGRAALERRRTSRAAEIAERLSRQVALLRAILALAEAEVEAAGAEADLHAARERLRVLELRWDRLVLEREGAGLTDAHPAREGGGGE